MNDIQTLDDLLQRHGSDFIHAAYFAILGRAPDPEGLRYYLSRLSAGYGKRSIVAQIARSPERTRRNRHLLSIRDDAAFVTAAYHALLGRAPDPDGFQHYLDFLRQGGDRRKMLEDIAASPEAQARAPKQARFEAELAALVEEEKKARHWFWRWFARGERLERQLYRLETELGRLAQATAATCADMQARLLRLESRPERGLSPGAQVAEGSGPSAPLQHLALLSPHARRMYRYLLAAANR
ncbi:DUF4214 domain-containing protein [Pelomicrobium methylotrophicum]|uniref:DUF4214 domain-containing protein n=1 Tax=Pelomicrobium methylotrophicum TaxID=2602750 RepID=A0A5C7ESV7_9PROT|nr:DUF4214 domain-containing protein [Pelomicrobium methylotrophicum]TXF10930.1 DUF4214 domain-containing protein [Pelomicrobium methylotrophicum]